MSKLNRDSQGHLALNQTFVGVKAVNNKTVSIKLAGPSAGGHGTIRFAFKHILDTASGGDDDAKAGRRVWHRVDKPGNKAENPHKGAKTGGLTRADKYASALKFNAETSKMANTAIYLSLMSLEKVLAEMANAFSYHSWGSKTQDDVEIEFSKPCIKTANGSGHVTGPVSHMKVVVYKIGDDAFELGHLKGTS